MFLGETSGGENEEHDENEVDDCGADHQYYEQAAEMVL